MIDTQTTEEAVDVYTRWNELEKQLTTQWGTGEDIIDFDLLQPRKVPEFKSRFQVLEKLEDLYDRVEPTTNEEQFIKAKLNASIYFIRALMGELIPFPEYMKNLTGVSPQLIPEEVVQKQKELMYAHMKDLGYKPESEPFEEFYKRIIISKEEALRQMETVKTTVPPLVQKVLDFDYLVIDHEIKKVEVDDFWGSWSSKKPGEPFLLRFNFHPTKQWRNGDIRRLALHEYVHFIHGQNLMNGIVKLQINPFIGITTVHDPHTFSAEGTANTILHLPEVEQGFSKYELLSRDRVITQHYLTNNAIIFANEGKNQDQILDYFSDFPFLTKKLVIDSIARWKKPSRKVYECVYGISHYTHRQLLDRLPPEKQKEFLRYELTTYEMPERLIEFANSLFLD